MLQCCLVEIGSRFRSAYCLHHQGSMMMEAASTSEMSVNFYQTYVATTQKTAIFRIKHCYECDGTAQSPWRLDDRGSIPDWGPPNVLSNRFEIPLFLGYSYRNVAAYRLVQPGNEVMNVSCGGWTWGKLYRETIVVNAGNQYRQCSETDGFDWRRL
jgi:hypothetical protein